MLVSIPINKTPIMPGKNKNNRVKVNSDIFTTKSHLFIWL